VLAELGCALGWGLHMVPPYTLDGQVVSSTAIRTLLGAGAVRGASELLGRPYSVRGTLEGDDLVVERLRTLPKPGPYVGLLRQGGASQESEVSVLASPTRMRLTGQVPHQDGPASFEFLRRGD
jgi:hypothetical protein